MFLYNTFYGCGQVVPSHCGKSWEGLGEGLGPSLEKIWGNSPITHRRGFTREGAGSASRVFGHR